MEILEQISMHYLNKKKKGAFLSLKEELFFENLIESNIPINYIIHAIDNSFYKYGSRINIRNIRRELITILKDRGFNIEL